MEEKIDAGGCQHGKKGHISLYEMQKADKPAIEEICDMILTSSVLREGMARLLALSRELRMKPCWSHTNVWHCNYKGKRVATYGVGNGSRWEENELKIKVETEKFDRIDDYLLTLPEDMRVECINGMKCDYCGGCAPGKERMILGDQYSVCRGSGYRSHKPTSQQFEWIEKFIIARREYIDRNRQ